MTWTKIIAGDESTLPPIGVPVWLYDPTEKKFPISSAYRDYHDDTGWAWVYGRCVFIWDRWQFFDCGYSTSKPTHWHPFPSVPEVGE